MTKKKKGGRRLRPGHSQRNPTPPPVSLVLPPIPGAVALADFQRIDKNLGAFAGARFGQVMPIVARGFFGAATPDEAQNAELRAAFALYFVHGWHDAEGRRVVDMFAEVGMPPQTPGEQAALDALRHTKLVFFRIDGREPEGGRMHGRDLVRDIDIDIEDGHTHQTLKDGDALLAYCFPTGKVQRPLGVGTQVHAARVAAVSEGLRRLADELDIARERLCDDRPDQAFWLVYRATNLPPATAKA